MWRRIWILINARNREYFRDKAAMGWNFIFPFVVIIGFSVIFGKDKQHLYRVGVLHSDPPSIAESDASWTAFRETEQIAFLPFASEEHALERLKHHRLDLVLDLRSKQYWISSTSPNGYVVERLFIASGVEADKRYRKTPIQGHEVSYVEWLLPGVLALNMMFSALYGVGYVIVRYRKNGVLKRMSVTPLYPWEFLTAQIASRMILMFVTTAIVFTGCFLLFDFSCRGSWLALLPVFFLGSFGLIAFGLIIASRTNSEELTDGMLNLVAWPMMFWSEVWFSMEGARPWVRHVAACFPLTHLIESARRIINDGASLYEVRHHMFAMAVMSIIFLLIGSILFKWQKR